MESLLIRNATLLTFVPHNPLLEKADLLIEGGRISRISAAGEIVAPSARIIDARGRVVMPGLINAHMHFYSTFARGLGGIAPASNFAQVLENLWWRLDKALSLQDCYFSSLVAMLDAIRHGTTTLIDHHASPGAVRGSLAAMVPAARETGLRTSFCYEVSDRDGAEIAAAGIAENAEFIQQYAKGDQFIKPLFGLHASFTLSDATLEKARSAAGGCGFHVHVAEAESDQHACERAHKQRVVERLARLGLLGTKTICAHCVHVDEREIDLLAKNNVCVVHNPQSNLNNAVGVANVLGMLEKGVLVGLGTDAMTVNMREEMRVAVWLQKHRNCNPSVGFVEGAQLLTSGNARIAQRIWDEPSLGTLCEGGVGDCIIVDYVPPTPLTKENWLGHFVFGLPLATVATTIAAGRLLMHERELQLAIDEDLIYAQSRKLALALWNRM